jgi:hypothetical protein
MVRQGKSEPSKPRGPQGDWMRGLIREERAPVLKPPVEMLPTVTPTDSQVRAIFIDRAGACWPGRSARGAGVAAAARLKA